MNINYLIYEEIIMSLENIKEYVGSYLYLINTNDKKVDKEEIDMYISAIPEIVDDIKILINELYEKAEN